MNKTLIVARRDFLAHIRKPAFLIATLGVPLLVAFIVFISSGQRRDESISSLGGVSQAAAAQSIKPFGYTDLSGTIKAVPPEFPPGLLRAYPDVASGQAAVAAGTINSLYVVPADYRATGKLTQYSAGVDAANGVTSGQLMRLVLLANLLPRPDLAAALRLEEPMRLDTVATAAPGALSATAGVSLATGFATVLTFAIFMSAGLLLQGLLEEKENRTLEVTLTSLAPQPFLLGKILGLGALGLIQFAVWAAFARAGLSMGMSALGDLGNLQLPPYLLALVIVYFLGGYLFYAAVMAGIGAISPSMRESSQYTVAVSLFATVPLMLITPLSSDPSGTLAVGLSLFPPTAAVTMPIRLALSDVPAWQIALSVGLLFAGVLGVIALAARLFRTTTLLRGTRLTPRELLRALAG
jgi:ABC-2 type transport system permease protein